MMNDSQISRLHPPPFRADRFYLVPELWLDDLLQPTELDVRELILAQNDGAYAYAAFPVNAPLRVWVRRNDDGRPLLLSHTTFIKHLKRLSACKASDIAFIRQCTDADVMVPDTTVTDEESPDRNQPSPDQPFRDCYVLGHWPEFEDRRILYRPRKYMENRWPAWLGATWGPRCALVGLMALMDGHASLMPNGVIEVVATRRQIRNAAAQIFPDNKVTAQIGAGLEQLNMQGLVSVVNRARNNRSYRFHTDVFDQRPGYSLKEVANACNLGLDKQAHWVALIRAFLMTNGKPLAQAPKIWALIRTCDPDVSTASDAAALLVELEQRAGHVTTNPKRVLGQYVERQQAERHTWLDSDEVALSLGGHGFNLSTPLTMPTIEDQRTHLGATQLVIRYERKRRLAVYQAMELANGVQLQIMQNEAIIPLTDRIFADRHSVEHVSVIDCNVLHTHEAFSYHAPFHLVARASAPSEDLVLHCRLRLKATGQ